MPAREVSPPLMVLQARGPLGWVRAVHVFFAMCCLFLAGGFALEPLIALSRTVGLGRSDLVLFTGAGALASLAVGGWIFRRRAGCAELFLDRVVVHRMSGDAVVAFFADLDSFDDLNSDFVRLRRHARDDAAAIDVPIPTPDEQARVTLMAALDAAGVPRGEDGATLARPAKTQAGPSVVVEAEVAAQLGVRRPGRVVFDERGVRLVHDPRFMRDRLDLALSWDDVVAWRTARPLLVRLVLRRGLLRRHVGEPIVFVASVERQREVEAALRQRAIPRLGMEEPPEP